MALFSRGAAAVVGFTAWDWHPLWDGFCLIDLFCHPNYWDEARSLMQSLALPDAEGHIVYNDVGCDLKSKVLMDEGFWQTGTLKGRVPDSRGRESYLDVAVFEKRQPKQAKS